MFIWIDKFIVLKNDFEKLKNVIILSHDRKICHGAEPLVQKHIDTQM